MSDPNPEPQPASAAPADEAPASTPAPTPAPALAPDATLQPTEAPAQPPATEPPAAEAPAAADAAPAAPAAPALADLSPAATAALLAEHFPALFTVGQAKPIKLRIQTDIQLRLPGVFTKKSLSLFLHRHTTSTPYLKALVASPQRFDLDGQPAGDVAAEHRDAAAAEVERRRAIVMAKRQAERQGQRPPRPAPVAGEAGAGADATRPPRADRPPRPPRPDQAPRADRPPRGDRPRPGDQPAGGRPPQARREHAPRHERPPQPPRPPRPERSERPPRAERAAPDHAPAPAPVDPAIAALSPEEQAGRRERALLLRAWETTTLTRSNFCVLKRISEAELEAQLAQARQERPAHVGHKPGR